MRGPWRQVRQLAELSDQEDEARRVRSLEVAIAENRRLDALLEERVEGLERAVVALFQRTPTGKEESGEE